MAQTLYKNGGEFSGLFAEHGELNFDAQVFEAEEVVDAIATGWYETPWEAKQAEEAAEAEAAEEVVTTRKRRTKAEIEAAQQAEAQPEAEQNGDNV